jgi:DNA-directed RNA polymerase specialized sigma24 family protein
MVIDFILAFKELLIQQDEEAFNKFYLETVDIFFRYLKANYFMDEDDMQDVIADFYIKCWNGFPSFDISQNFSGWVWSIFKNTLKDFWKKK